MCSELDQLPAKSKTKVKGHIEMPKAKIIDQFFLCKLLNEASIINDTFPLE